MPLSDDDPPSPSEPPAVPDAPASPEAGDERFPWPWVSNLCLGAAVLFAAMALARYRTWHNPTFDLAFYARIVWGIGHLDFYNPLVGTDLWGLHLSLILLPLGLIGRFVPIVPMMLILQAASVAGAGIPLARIAARRVGHPAASFVALGLWFLHPVVGSIATYEFHPSSLALLPLCLALDFIDRRRSIPALIALVVAASCREDVALACSLVGAVMALRPATRTAGLVAFVGFALWFVVYLFVIAPKHLPRAGSLELHYGHLGGSPAAILGQLLRHPVDTLRVLATPVRLLYAPRMLLPVAFVALLRPKWLLPALAPFAINFLSQFPTAVQVHSHYSTLVVPFVLVAGVHGAAHLMVVGRSQSDRVGIAVAVAAALASLHLQHRAGNLPLLGGRFDAREYLPDARMQALDAVAEIIPPDASVTAPDYALAHLAERPLVMRLAPLLARRVDFVVLSLEHRALHTGSQEIWRNEEEAPVRGMMMQRRYGVYSRVGDYLVLRGGWPSRTYARGRYVEVPPDPRVRAFHRDVGDSLAVAGWGVTPLARGSHVVLLLVPKRPWPLDLGFELGWGPLRPHLDREDPERTYAFLPFDGVFMPGFARVGEVVRTEVDLPATPAELRAHGLRFGARRVDGSRLDASSEHWTTLR